MKKLFAFTFAAFLLVAPGCKTAEKQQETTSMATTVDNAQIPSEFRKKTAKELRREERRRQKKSALYYNR